MPSIGRKFEAGKFKGWRHHAAYERPSAEWPRCLPMAFGYKQLRILPRDYVGPQNSAVNRPAIIWRCQQHYGAA